MEALAQIGADPSAFAFAAIAYPIVVAVWGFLLLCSFIAFVAGAWEFKRIRGKIWSVCGATFGAGLLYAAYIAMVPPYVKVVLDFRTSRNPPAGKWIGLHEDQDMSYQGRVDLQLALPHNKAFDGRVSLVNLNKFGSQITGVSIQRFELARDEAFAMASHYMNEWDCDRRDYDQWCANRLAGKKELYGNDRVFSAGNTKLIPELSVSLRAVSEDSWALQMGAHWPRE